MGNWEKIAKRRKIFTKKFLICYSDNYIDFNLIKHLKKFQSSDITLTIFKKKSGNLKISGKKYHYNNDRTNKDYNFVELGYILAKKNITKFLNKKYNKPLSFFLIKYLKKKNILSSC